MSPPFSFCQELKVTAKCSHLLGFTMVIIVLLDCDEGLFQVGNQIVHVFEAD